jgi:hypothetical protein
MIRNKRKARNALIIALKVEFPLAGVRQCAEEVFQLSMPAGCGRAGALSAIGSLSGRI